MIRSERFAEFRAHSPHPYLEVVNEADFIASWLGPDSSGAGIFRTASDSLWVLFLGPEVDALALTVQSELRQPMRWTVPRGSEQLLTTEHSRWDWWAIRQPPIWPVEVPAIEDLGRSRDDEITEFLAKASPTASTKPGSDEVITWHGIREGDALVAVGAAIRWQSGAAVLASIATAPDHRGRKLARAITASLTQMLWDAGEKRITLGMYADNESARRTYTSVGYCVEGEFSSGEPRYSSGEASTPASAR